MKWYPNLPNGSTYCSQGPMCTPESENQGDACYYDWMTTLYESQAACCVSVGCDATTTTTVAPTTTTEEPTTTEAASSTTTATTTTAAVSTHVFTKCTLDLLPKILFLSKSVH